MKLHYHELLVIRERLKLELRKGKPALKSLCRHDASGMFTELARLSVGLKLNVALESLRNNQYCKCCETHLAKVFVCPTCLKTPKGMQLSLELQGRKVSEAWKNKSQEELKSINQLRREAAMRIHNSPHHMKTVAVREKVQAGCLRTLGVSNPSYSKRILAKRVRTSIRNCGFPNPMQNPETFEKQQRSAKKLRKFVSKTGEVHLCRGYEPQVLEFLDSHPLVEKFCTRTGTELLPTVRYAGIGGRLGKRPIYHPDIGVRLKDGRNLIVEVKSIFHLWKDEDCNRRKFNATTYCCSKRPGWIFWLAVYDPKTDEISWESETSKESWIVPKSFI